MLVTHYIVDGCDALRSAALDCRRSISMNAASQRLEDPSFEYEQSRRGLYDRLQAILLVIN